jgi:hypothetical protein
MTMNLTSTIRILTGSMALAVGSSAMGQSLTLLGFPDGSAGSVAKDLSDDGGIVIGESYSYSAAPTFVARNGIREDSSLTNYQLVTGDGRFLVGTSRSNFLTYRYNSDGSGPTLIPAAPGAPAGAQPRAVSRDGGTIAGNSSNSISRAWYWTSATSSVLMPRVATWDYAYGVSPEGRYVVGFGESANLGQPFLYDITTQQYQFLQTPASTNYAKAFATSENGAVTVGWAIGLVGLGNYDPVLWRNGQIESLITSASSFRSGQPSSVSADGTIIAGNGDTGGTTGMGFVWTQATGMVTANEYLANVGITLPANSIVTNAIVSGDGKSFSGTIEIGSTYQAFVATVPGLGGPALGFIATIGMRRRRRDTAGGTKIAGSEDRFGPR